MTKTKGISKPSPHQLYMLGLFANGWRFNIWNKKPGSWLTYWALRKKGLCNHVGSKDVLTDKGRFALEKWGLVCTKGGTHATAQTDCATGSDNEAVRKEEREACASRCDAVPASGPPTDCTVAIRARKNKEATEN